MLGKKSNDADEGCCCGDADPGVVKQDAVELFELIEFSDLVEDEELLIDVSALELVEPVDNFLHSPCFLSSPSDCGGSGWETFGMDL